MNKTKEKIKIKTTMINEENKMNKTKVIKLTARYREYHHK